MREEVKTERGGGSGDWTEHRITCRGRAQKLAVTKQRRVLPTGRPHRRLPQRRPVAGGSAAIGQVNVNGRRRGGRGARLSSPQRPWIAPDTALPASASAPPPPRPRPLRLGGGTRRTEPVTPAGRGGLIERSPIEWKGRHMASEI